MNSFEFNKLNSVFALTKNYCHLAKKEDYMEVTEWKNGEGFDVNISSRGSEQRFSLTHGELELLQILIRIKEQ